MAYNNENLNLLSTSKSGSLGSQIGGATKPGQFNAQNFASTLQSGERTLAPTPTTTQSSSTKPQTYGSAATGYFNTYQEAVNAANNFDPTVNPASVNVNIDDVIDSSALNSTPSVTNAEQNRRQRENNVLKFKYEKESEDLLSKIERLNYGIADLGGQQAREMFEAKKNLPGQLRGGLQSDLSRLTEEQAIEMNARTGQLNAMLDQYALYEGYRPQMIGTPQIDPATGMGYAYIEDPTTGEISIQDLGQITAGASGGGEGFKLGRYDTQYDAQGNPIAYGMGAFGGGGEIGEGSSGLFEFGKQFGEYSGGVENVMGNYAFKNSESIIKFVDKYEAALEEGALTGIPSLIGRFGTGETGKANLAAKTIKALIGFDTLQKMRDNSPTGGALGQVSEREIDFLQSVEGELGLYQNEEALAVTLEDVKQSALIVTATIKLDNGLPLSPRENIALAQKYGNLLGNPSLVDDTQTREMEADFYSNN